MNLKSSLKEIKKFLKKRYKSNLAVILVFGSANTGEWKEGVSDIDLIILLKEKNKLDLKEEFNKIINELKNLNISIVHFRVIRNYEEKIYEKGSWASWITVINGSKKIYSSKEFRKFRKRLIKKPLSKRRLIEYIKHKDKFELAYIKKDKGRIKAKGLFSHLRRKLQIINYLQNGKVCFDYDRCLRKIRLEKDYKQKLKILSKDYKNKKILSEGENVYYLISKRLTNRILKEI